MSFSRSLLALLVASLAVFGQEAKPPSQPAPPAAPAKDTDKPAPLPGDAHVAQSMQLDGKTLHYTVAIGTLPVFDNAKKIGEVVLTAYTLEGPDRPVTFALNGGPGAASVFLNLGAIGPKRIQF